MIVKKDVEKEQTPLHRAGRENAPIFLWETKSLWISLMMAKLWWKRRRWKYKDPNAASSQSMYQRWEKGLK